MDGDVGGGVWWGGLTSIVCAREGPGMVAGGREGVLARRELVRLCGVDVRFVKESGFVLRRGCGPTPTSCLPPPLKPRGLCLFISPRIFY
jgi:hypothetical protein